MIRARCETTEGRPLILLGLSKANVNHMLGGHPIRATGASVGIPDVDSVVIFYGETEAAMIATLRAQGLLTEDTAVTPEREPPAGTSR